MTTAKPKWGYASKSFFAFHPTKESFNELIGYIERRASIKADEEFTEKLHRLYILLKRRIETEKQAPSKEELLAEVKQFKTALMKVDEILSYKGLSEILRTDFIGHIITRGLSEKDDPLYCTHYGAHALVEICTEIQKEITASKKDPNRSITAFRNVVAEELARAISAIGHEPKATRNGPFHNCFDAFMAAAGWEREDTFYIVRKAIKTYPTKPMFGILEKGKKFPGLTG